jgi:anti-sigma B factor antagonist
MTGEIDGAGPVIVGLPTEIDMQNADEVRDRLCAEAKPGIAVVVADLSLTEFCDSMGIREIVRGLRLLAGVGVELRLVIPPGTVRRVMQLIGLDQAVTVWPSVAAAVEGSLDQASAPAVAPAPQARGSALNPGVG